jgi:predicted metal-binding protein
LSYERVDVVEAQTADCLTTAITCAQCSGRLGSRILKSLHPYFAKQTNLASASNMMMLADSSMNLRSEGAILELSCLIRMPQLAHGVMNGDTR